MHYDKTSESNQTFIYFFLIVKMRVTDHKVLSETECYIIIIPVCNVSRLICVFDILVFSLFCLSCIDRPVLQGHYNVMIIVWYIISCSIKIVKSRTQKIKT